MRSRPCLILVSTSNFLPSEIPSDIPLGQDMLAGERANFALHAGKGVYLCFRCRNPRLQEVDNPGW